MSRFNRYNNIHDPDDDGADIEITEQHYALSDDEGRREAVVLLQTGNAITGKGKHVHDHRRMFYRWAKKELVDGRGRREAAAASETAAVAAEKARIAGEEKAEKDKAAKEAKHARDLENFRRDGQESEERWARINEETRVANAAWAAGKEARDAAQRAQEAEVRASPTQMATSRPSEPRPQHRLGSPTAPIPTRNAGPPLAPATIPPATSTANPTTSAPRPVRTTPPGRTSARLPEPTKVPSQTRPVTGTSRPPDPGRHSRQAPRSETQSRVVPTSTQAGWAPPSSAWPPRQAPAATPALLSPGGPAPAPPPIVVREAPRPALLGPGGVLTGADLSAWRAARGLTQRPAAELLGVAPSTVAKAELLPGKVLGDQLQVALAAALGA